MAHTRSSAHAAVPRRTAGSAAPTTTTPALSGARQARLDPARARPAPAPLQTFVLGSSSVLCQSIIQSLHLRQAVALRLDSAFVAQDTRPILNACPELAIVIEAEIGATLTAIRALKQRWHDTRVLVIGTSDREDAVLGCVAAGADGVMAPDESHKQLKQATRQVLANAFRPPPNVVRPFFDRLVRLDAKSSGHGGKLGVTRLSAREIEILKHVARGETNKDIASRLSIEEQTVKNHITRILRKLGVRSRYDAARIAAEHVR